MKQQPQENWEKEYIVFRRPISCVVKFLAQDCNEYFYNLQEINPKDFLSQSQAQAEKRGILLGKEIGEEDGINNGILMSNKEIVVKIRQEERQKCQKEKREMLGEIEKELEILHDQIKVGNVEPLRGILNLRTSLKTKIENLP